MENFSRDWILQGKDFQGLEKLQAKVSEVWKKSVRVFQALERPHAAGAGAT
jgi:hypothetical protein